MAEVDNSKRFFNELSKLRGNLIKETLEVLGDDYFETEANVKYHNYLDTSLSGVSVLGYDGDTDSGNDLSIPGNITISKFVDYNGAADGSIGSRAFPQGKGKCIDPNGTYWPFYTFGFGASPKKRPAKAFSARSGVECCKLAVNTILGYLNKGCKTIGDVICMYHAGMPSYDKFLQYYNSISGIRDIADGRFVSSAEMIKRQNYYQQHLVDYVHMSNKTPITRSYKVLFPLITFISRQEQGVNCEDACKIALKEMGIS